MGAVLRGMRNPFRHRARAVVVIALLALVISLLALLVQAALAGRADRLLHLADGRLANDLRRDEPCLMM